MQCHNGNELASVCVSSLGITAAVGKLVRPTGKMLGWQVDREHKFKSAVHFDLPFSSNILTYFLWLPPAPPPPTPSPSPIPHPTPVQETSDCLTLQSVSVQDHVVMSCLLLTFLFKRFMIYLVSCHSATILYWSSSVQSPLHLTTTTTTTLLSQSWSPSPDTNGH